MQESLENSREQSRASRQNCAPTGPGPLHPRGPLSGQVQSRREVGCEAKPGPYPEGSVSGLRSPVAKGEGELCVKHLCRPAGRPGQGVERDVLLHGLPSGWPCSRKERDSGSISPAVELLEVHLPEEPAINLPLSDGLCCPGPWGLILRQVSKGGQAAGLQRLSLGSSTGCPGRGLGGPAPRAPTSGCGPGHASSSHRYSLAGTSSMARGPRARRAGQIHAGSGQGGKVGARLGPRPRHLPGQEVMFGAGRPRSEPASPVTV